MTLTFTTVLVVFVTREQLQLGPTTQLSTVSGTISRVHQSSLFIVSQFASTYVSASSRVLEVGSWSPSGSPSAKRCFSGSIRYVGLDLINGPGVDVVANNPYHWWTLFPAQYDATLSCQTFEHNPYFWLTLLNMALVLKPGGLMLVVAPSSGPVHRHPLDCYRFYPDAAPAMASYINFRLLETATLDQDYKLRGSSNWRDWFMVCQKPSDSESDDELAKRILADHIHLSNPKPVRTLPGPINHALQAHK